MSPPHRPSRANRGMNWSSTVQAQKYEILQPFLTSAPRNAKLEAFARVGYRVVSVNEVLKAMVRRF